MFWTGSKAAIEAAERVASSQVVGKPEYLDGEEVPVEDRVTARWAVPVEAGGVWLIPAYPGMNLPSGVKEALEAPGEEA